CRFCGNPIARPEGEKVARCTGGLECPSRLREWLAHFASRSGMDIEGLGYKTIDLLIREGLISDPADIFFLRPEQFEGFEGWAEVSVGNLMAAIDAARDRPLDRLLRALGIRYVGGTVARVLARHFRSMGALMAASEEELAGIDGVGGKIARSVRAWADASDTARLVDKLREGAVRLADPEPERAVGDTLAGLTMVITGALGSMSRDQAKAAIEERGGKVVNSVSKRTSAVIVGESPGSKLARAEELGVPILTEERFGRLLEEGRSVLEER
ncbi:MAG: helix-hairpin-helix domain-containing protein, partial [Acidimicrobiia bacterium]